MADRRHCAPSVQHKAKVLRQLAFRAPSIADKLKHQRESEAALRRSAAYHQPHTPMVTSSLATTPTNDYCISVSKLFWFVIKLERCEAGTAQHAAHALFACHLSRGCTSSIGRNSVQDA